MDFVADTVPYATPSDRPIGPRVWAAAAIALAGLGLLVIGGCFLIGVMLITTATFGGSGAKLTSNQLHLVELLYVLAFAAFAGGITVLLMGLRGLLRVIRSG